MYHAFPVISKGSFVKGMGSNRAEYQSSEKKIIEFKIMPKCFLILYSSSLNVVKDYLRINEYGIL